MKLLRLVKEVLKGLWDGTLVVRYLDNLASKLKGTKQ